MRSLVPILYSLAWAIAVPSSVAGQATRSALSAEADDQRCLNCHGQRHIATAPIDERRTMVAVNPGETLPLRQSSDSLFVEVAALRAAVHGDVPCVACHRGAEKLPHSPLLPEPQCADCHAEAAVAVSRSRHAEVALQSDPPAPRCWNCHGGHTILPKSDRRSKVFPLEVIKTCGSCHRRHAESTSSPADGAVWVEAYLESVHGRSLTRAGLVVGATCAECHGHHEVLPSRDPRSRVHRSNIPDTCGHCHVGVREEFEETVHAAVARREDPSMTAPVCSDCHTSHQITHAASPTFLRDIVSECGSCHQDLYRTYRQSYHGQVQGLGSTRAARCSDCHGAHNIRRVNDPLSTLSTANRPASCARCHVEMEALSATAKANFVAYQPHADFRDRTKNPSLFFVWRGSIAAGCLVFAIWALHALGCLVRRVRGSRPDDLTRESTDEPTAIRRFHGWHRLTHLLVLVSFVGLALTGVPLRFSTQPWALGLVDSLGGPESAAWAHRFFAALLGVAALAHVVYLVYVAVAPRRVVEEGESGSFWERARGPYSMLPARRDFAAVGRMLRWIAGRGPRPAFDRWSYWEKFDYWASWIVLGVIGASGLVLWYPTLFAGFVSGSWFNVALVVHGSAALLAVGFVFLIHLLNVSLRWGKFPTIAVIFTGKLSEKQFRRERHEEYERLERTGDLDGFRVPRTSTWGYRLAVAATAVSLVVGVVIVGLITWAALI